MFRLFLPTIIRELRSLTKVTLVIYVYDVNGMMAACLQFNITMNYYHNHRLYPWVSISEQQVSELNPLYTVANLTRLMPGITLAANEGQEEDGQDHIQNHRIH